MAKAQKDCSSLSSFAVFVVFVVKILFLNTIEQALEEPTADTFHEWRKQVNHLRHQLQLLQTMQLGQIKRTLRAFKSLAEILGLKNDLAVLTHQLERTQGKAKAMIPPALQELIQARDKAFTEEAIALGQQLYEPKAKALLRSIW